MKNPPVNKIHSIAGIHSLFKRKHLNDDMIEPYSVFVEIFTDEQWEHWRHEPW